MNWFQRRFHKHWWHRHTEFNKSGEITKQYWYCADCGNQDQTEIDKYTSGLPSGM